MAGLVDGKKISRTEGRSSDTQLLVKPAESVTHNVKLMSQVFHHTVDAGSVLQDVYTLCVGVVAHGEGTLNGLGKLPKG